MCVDWMDCHIIMVIGKIEFTLIIHNSIEKKIAVSHFIGLHFIKNAYVY